MFGIYGSSQNIMGEQSLEKRALCFAAERTSRDAQSAGEGGHAVGEDVMEVRVYRAKARKRILPQVEELINTEHVKRETRHKKSQSQSQQGQDGSEIQ